ncbi:hypothetical protein U1Q18_020534 [Sarracenia purpurea var. burkii]
MVRSSSPEARELDVENETQPTYEGQSSPANQNEVLAKAAHDVNREGKSCDTTRVSPRTDAVEGGEELVEDIVSVDEKPEVEISDLMIDSVKYDIAMSNQKLKDMLEIKAHQAREAKGKQVQGQTDNPRDALCGDTNKFESLLENPYITYEGPTIPTSAKIAHPDSGVEPLSTGIAAQPEISGENPAHGHFLPAVFDTLLHPNPQLRLYCFVFGEACFLSYRKMEAAVVLFVSGFCCCAATSFVGLAVADLLLIFDTAVAWVGFLMFCFC